METVNIWESNVKNNNYYFNSIDELIEYESKENKNITFILYDEYKTGFPEIGLYDNKAHASNINLVYTDNDHKITVGNIFNDIYINTKYYANNKKEINDKIKKCYINSIRSKYFIFLSPQVIDDEIISVIAQEAQKRDFTVTIDGDIDLTNEQIQILKDAHSNVEIIDDNKKKQISTNLAINNITFNDLLQKDKIIIRFPLSQEDMNNLIYIRENTTIVIDLPYGEKVPKEYYFNVKQILNRLCIIGKKYKVNFTIYSREQARESGLFDDHFDNLELNVENDLSSFTLDEYKRQEEQLEVMASPIRNSNMSNYEKYLAVYDIVKQYKKYQHSPQDRPMESRDLKYILDNDYIVCVGFSALLKELCERVGIPCIKESATVAINNKNNANELDHAGHARNIIKIDDEKYNIHGLYLADATWDNDLDNDLYFNCNLTFDQKKEAYNMEYLNTNDLLLDFHNITDFNVKINRIFRQKYEENKQYDNNSDAVSVEEALRSIYNDVMNCLYVLDIDKYNYFAQKYPLENFSYKSTDKDYLRSSKLLETFLSEYAEYIIPLSNNKIPFEKTMQAAENVKRFAGFTDEDIQRWKEETYNKYNDEVNLYFPYYYDSNNPVEGFLEERTEKIR